MSEIFDAAVTAYFKGKLNKEELMKWCKNTAKQLRAHYHVSYDAVYMGQEANVHVVDFLLGSTPNDKDVDFLSKLLKEFERDNPSVEVDRSLPEVYKSRHYEGLYSN